MKASRVTEYFLEHLTDASFVVRQKLGIFVWISIVSSIVLFLVSVINLTTPVSTNPELITIMNVLSMLSFPAALVLIRRGKYNLAIIVASSFLLIRVLGGCIVKFDIYVETGTNNNMMFMFLVIVFVGLFGTRRLLTIAFGMLVFIIIAFAAVARTLYVPTNVNYLVGTSINMVITLIGIYLSTFLITLITDRALYLAAEELDRNRLLSDSLEHKVIELQAMNEEMEAMNETLKETSEELVERNNELAIFKDLAEASSQGFAITGLQGRIIYANAAMMGMLHGDRNRTPAGEDLLAFYTTENRKRMDEAILPAVRDGGSWSGEITLVSSLGLEIPTIQNIFLLRSRSGRPSSYAFVVADLTERTKLEAQLIHAQKMEAVGRLSGGIAHDFNNFLTAITGYSDLILSQMDRTDPRRENLEEILRAAEKSSALTRQLLAFSRKQILRPSIVDVNDEVNDMKKLLDRLIGEKIELSTRLEEQLLSVRIDPVQVAQIILNLVINARDAMPTGGKLVIRTDNVEFPDSTGAIPDMARHGIYVKLSIGDTGTGIESEHLSRIFEPFYSTKETGKGTGLGLSLIKDIASQYEGWVTVESELGKGTVFSIFLPALAEPARTPQRERIPLGRMRGDDRRVLLVEDQEEVRNFAAAALKRQGYRVREARTSIEAQRIFEEERGNFDIVVSDVVLPDRSGIELMHALRSQKPDLRFLLSSGYTDQESEVREIVEKKYDFLAKPYTLYDLLKAVYDSLGQK